MSLRRSSTVLVAVSALLPACTGHFRYDRSQDPGEQPLSPSANAWVLTDQDLEVNPTWTVLQAIAGHVPNVKTSSDGTPNGCPRVDIRGHDSVSGSSNPTVYVDGTRTSDTCVLSSLLAPEVNRVEVYPLGVTPRAGYMTSPHGLILIFMKRGDVGT